MSSVPTVQVGVQLRLAPAGAELLRLEAGLAEAGLAD